MTSRRLLLVLAWLALIALAPGCQRSQGASGRARIVSLAPAITETLFAIGAGPQVIAVSDYCDSPADVRTRPRVGTSITPNYEAIARLEPTLLLGEANASSRQRELDALARTRLLPWLTLEEIAKSTLELGELTGTQAAAKALADKLTRRLDVPEPASGPSVLLVLGGEGADDSEIWFVRRNSLHGAALRAAGARNAVTEDVAGPPRLSHERLLQLDPEFIVILTRKGASAGSPLAGFERFPTLRAVQANRVARLTAPEAFANGPRILTLVDSLHRELVRLGALP